MATFTLAQETTRMDWTQFRPTGGLYCLPAIAISLVTGLAFHEPAAGMIAAGAAFNVGFGAFRRVQNSRVAPMVLAMIGTSFSAFVGTLVSFSSGGAALAAGLWGFLYGLLVIYGDDISWVGLQGGIALLVSGAYPGTMSHALLRGGIVLAGGMLQMALLLAIWAVQGVASLREDFARLEYRQSLRAVRAELNPRNPASKLNLDACAYALRVALTLALAVLLYRFAHLQNGYWLPLTTLLILKPDFYRTYAVGFGRMLGTLVGVVVATALTWLLHPQPLVLTGLVLLFCWLAYAFQKVNYALFSGWITAFIVFLVAITGLPETVVTVHRLLDTALGSGLALISRGVGMSWKAAHPAGVVVEKSASCSGGL